MSLSTQLLLAGNVGMDVRIVDATCACQVNFSLKEMTGELIVQVREHLVATNAGRDEDKTKKRNHKQVPGITIECVLLLLSLAIERVLLL